MLAAISDLLVAVGEKSGNRGLMIKDHVDVSGSVALGVGGTGTVWCGRMGSDARMLGVLAGNLDSHCAVLE